ncbi:MAG TPA: SRPBCC family protein [Candidatus Rubrimentiphilum sp.]|nr:SRPBCC family protein [Candidatus Rubrimentiphilum sp.]
MHDRRNVAPSERWLSFGAGMLMGAAAAHLLYRAATGYCPIYAALGIASVPDGRTHNPNASVPYGTGVRVEETIAIEMPASGLYAFWRRLETLPQFMHHLDDVTVLTPTRSRWRVHAPGGKLVSWEAEIVNDVPDKLIGWRSLPGSAVNHAGSVHFDRRGSVTDVRVVLEYVPRAPFGASIAKLLGEEPQKQLAEDLERFKSIAERGEICAS